MNEASENVVQIDEAHLDKECIRLPSDYLKWAHKSADAKRDVDEAKNALEVAEADASRDIRENPARYGLEKVTEKAIGECLATAPSYQAKVRAHIEAKHKAEMVQAVVWALEHKKRTLTLLVELHGMGYFSQPKVSAKGREAVDDMLKKNMRRAHSLYKD